MAQRCSSICSRRAVASALMVIVARNPVHSVLFLILAFFNAAGLFMLLGAEFLAMILVIVYVGAVAVLFLFVVMMLDVDFAELRSGFIKNAPVGLDRRRLVLAELLLVFVGARLRRRRRAAPARVAGAAGVQHRRRSGRVLYTRLRLLLRGRRAGAARRHDRRHRADAAPQAGRQAPVDRRRRSRARRQTASSRQGPPGKVASRTAARGHGRERAAMTSALGHYLTVAACLFTLGMFGIFLNRKNVIVILMSIELMLLAVNINFVAFSLPRRSRRAGVRAVRPDRRRRRGRHRPRHPRHLSSATAARSRSKTST